VQTSRNIAGSNPGADLFPFTVRSKFEQFKHIELTVTAVTDYSGGRWYWINGERYNSKWFTR
jgi:hypothetical protein